MYRKMQKPYMRYTIEEVIRYCEIRHAEQCADCVLTDLYGRCLVYEPYRWRYKEYYGEQNKGC